jgi:hypothetical protein
MGEPDFQIIWLVNYYWFSDLYAAAVYVRK